MPGAILRRMPVAKELRRCLKQVDGKYPPVAKLLGIEIVKQSKGKALLTMKTKKTHLNTIGSVHGGILCDISDAAMGYAFTSLLAKGRIGVTVEFKINFLKPVFESEELKASARVVSHGSTLYFTECELHNGKNHLVAKSSGLCKILR